MRELEPADPQVIGTYRLLGQLGRGGMGQVFLGVSAGGRLVAVKVIRAELATDAEFRARFGREIAAARKVSGLFTAAVVDADVDGPLPWLATAYVAGPSLAQAVAENGPLPASSVLALAAGLAESLTAIHAAGVVHRDLKPSTVLLADDGPRVIDFGISRAAEGTSMTHTGFWLGSPGFMPPEQAEGGGVRPASDIFSLGAVLVFAATGEGPFGTGSTAALVYRVVHSQPNLDRVPDEVRPLAERCLAKDPGERPTAAELLAEVGGVQLASGWLPESLTTLADRHSPPPDAVGHAQTVTTAGGGRTPAPGTASGEPTLRPRRGRRRVAWVAAAVAVIAAAASAAILLSSPGGARPQAAASGPKQSAAGQPLGSPLSPGGAPRTSAAVPVSSPAQGPNSTPATRPESSQSSGGTSRTVTTATPGAPISAGNRPWYIAITPNGTTAYVTDFGSDTVTPINLATGTPGAPITVGNSPYEIAITPNGTTAYVTNSGSGTVTPISLPSGTPGNSIKVGNEPEGIAITPDGTTAYVADQHTDTITPISLPGNTPGTPVTVAAYPDGIAITPDGKTAYTTDNGIGWVTPVNLVTGMAGLSVAAKGPIGIVIAPGGKTAYFANYSAATITPVDLSSGTFGTPIKVGATPIAIAFTPDGRTAYVANSGDGTVTPISLPPA